MRARCFGLVINSIDVYEFDRNDEQQVAKFQQTPTLSSEVVFKQIIGDEESIFDFIGERESIISNEGVGNKINGK